MSKPRIIKKYPNRRLYDTEVSSYVTLEDVRNLVLQEIPFQVCDARTNEDLTRSILLQIIMEQEADGEPMFSEQVLAKIIRSYGDSLQGMMASYLERSLNLFVEQQARVQDQMKTMMGSDPLSIRPAWLSDHGGVRRPAAFDERTRQPEGRPAPHLALRDALESWIAERGGSAGGHRAGTCESRCRVSCRRG